MVLLLSGKITSQATLSAVYPTLTIRVLIVEELVQCLFDYAHTLTGVSGG